MKVLVTGGAGFIGSSVVRDLLRVGSEITVLDNFHPQVHGDNRTLAPDIARHVRLLVADVRDEDAIAQAVAGQEAIVHLAAETGTGQSMYEVTRYEQVNVGGTANLLQAISNDRNRTLRRLVVASSRSIYGEGCYRSPSGSAVFPKARSLNDLREGRFEPLDPTTGEACTVLPTREDAPLHPTSFYGLTKQVQEQMCLLWAETLGFSAYALRYQNVFGPGQSLKNPYTGILAIFSNQARANQPISIFEDGQESRDFVYIQDVVDATIAAVLRPGTEVAALNVGSGVRTTVSEVVEEIITFFSSSSPVSITGAFRQGDIRHCVADLELIRSSLGFEPRWSFRAGVENFLKWAASQDAAGNDAYATSLSEMRERGFYHV